MNGQDMIFFLLSECVIDVQTTLLLVLVPCLEKREGTMVCSVIFIMISYSLYKEVRGDKREEM